MEIGNKECRDLSEILKVNYSLQELNLEGNKPFFFKFLI